MLLCLLVRLGVKHEELPRSRSSRHGAADTPPPLAPHRLSPRRDMPEFNILLCPSPATSSSATCQRPSLGPHLPASVLLSVHTYLPVMNPRNWCCTLRVSGTMPLALAVRNRGRLRSSGSGVTCIALQLVLRCWSGARVSVLMFSGCMHRFPGGAHMHGLFVPSPCDVCP